MVVALPSPDPDDQVAAAGDSTPPPSTLTSGSLPKPTPPGGGSTVFSGPPSSAALTPNSAAPSLVPGKPLNAGGGVGLSASLPPVGGPALPPKPPVAAPPPVTSPAPAPTPTSQSSLPPTPPVIGSGAPTALSMTSGASPKASTAAAPASPAVAPASAPKPAAAKKPKLAAIRQSPLRFLPFVLAGVLVVGGVIFVISRILGGGGSTPAGSTADLDSKSAATTPGKQTTLTYWTLWEPCEVFETAFKQFEQQNPGVLIDCEQQVATQYRQRLQTAIANKTGPDIFRFHASWTPMLSRELSPVPNNVLNSAQLRQDYYPIVERQMTVGGQIAGIPLMYDGLVLYYNRALLNTAGINPPNTWADLRGVARTLTLKDESGRVTRGGLAIGTTSNVEHYGDILGLLILQNGGNPAQPTQKEVREAVEFYTNFVKVDGVWSSELPNATVAFAREEVAMIIAPSWRAHEIRSLNPRLDFGVVGAPQLSTSAPVTWATYWAEGVSAQSSNQAEAWKLLAYLSSEEGMQQLYSAQSQVRSFGEPYARKSLASELANEPVLSALFSQANVAGNWYLNSLTHDEGLNDQIEKYYGDAINAILGGKDSESALETVELGVQQVLRQFGLGEASSTSQTSSQSTT